MSFMSILPSSLMSKLHVCGHASQVISCQYPSSSTVAPNARAANAISFMSSARADTVTVGVLDTAKNLNRDSFYDLLKLESERDREKTNHDQMKEIAKNAELKYTENG